MSLTSSSQTALARGGPQPSNAVLEALRTPPVRRVDNIQRAERQSPPRKGNDSTITHPDQMPGGPDDSWDEVVNGVGDHLEGLEHAVASISWVLGVSSQTAQTFLLVGGGVACLGLGALAYAYLT